MVVVVVFANKYVNVNVNMNMSVNVIPSKWMDG